MEIKNLKGALALFEEASIKQAEATEQGDYKAGNKCYNQIIKVMEFIKREESMHLLIDYLNSPFVGTKLWAACYSLPINEEESIKALEDITRSKGIHSLTAETTLILWKQGKLNLV